MIPVGNHHFQVPCLKFGGVIVVNIPLMKNGFSTLLRTNISPYQGTFENDFPFPKVGYVSFYTNGERVFYTN